MFLFLPMFFKKIFKNNKTQSDLEAYIVSRHPQNVGDVDRLEREYQQRQNSRQANYF